MRVDSDRIVVHLDYDCFYASVIEAQNPLLKGKPLAVQQKQIIVTCNYEARNRGLRKLQLVKDARKICPDVIIVLGEDLTPFRNASKLLYNFLRSFAWNAKIERLGLDEIFLDATDIVQYNVDLLPSDLTETFFHLSRHDPTHGFAFNANRLAGHAFPILSDEIELSQLDRHDTLRIRLSLASHFAEYVRLQLEEQWGYTSTVGVSTCKLLSKLVGNINKPRAQTTLMPPYVTHSGEPSNVTVFMDALEVGKVPGIGFKTANKLRELVLQRPPAFDGWELDDNDAIHVRDVRAIPGVNAAILDRALASPGAPHGVGLYFWNLLHGIDTSAVASARDVPKQISIEDSYGSIDTIEAVIVEMIKLSKSLIKRIRIDLLEQQSEQSITDSTTPAIRWLARPKTLRLSTRRARRLDSGDKSNFIDPRAAYYNRTSRTCPVPGFLFNSTESVDILAAKLVHEYLVPLFHKLHPEENGWSLSLINVAVTNMQEAGGEAKGAVGRDIGRMFRNQESTLREWTVYEDGDTEEEYDSVSGEPELQTTIAMNEEYEMDESRGLEEGIPLSTQRSQASEGWVEEESTSFEDYSNCSQCGASIPSFAMAAHERFHEKGD